MQMMAKINWKNDLKEKVSQLGKLQKNMKIYLEMGCRN
jgi:hypothetical protein